MLRTTKQQRIDILEASLRRERDAHQDTKTQLAKAEAALKVYENLVDTVRMYMRSL